MISAQGGYNGSSGKETRRRSCDITRTQLLGERSSFDSHWRDIADFIRPRRARFQVSETNRGDKKNQKIINSKATTASRTLRSGMMSGITSPSRQWFRLSVPDPGLAEDWEVKNWLDTVTKRMNEKFLGSNLYNSLPTFYEDLGDMGTSVIYIEEDFENLIHTEVFPIGSYALSMDEKGRPSVFMREFSMTVRQLVAKFGVMDEKGNVTNWENFSNAVHQMWENNQRETRVTVCHIIQPNDIWNPKRLESKYKRFSSDYFETGGGNSGAKGYITESDYERFLKQSGYDVFPVLAAFWERSPEDSYGTDCPGMTALGDIKSLQAMEKRLANATDKMINPPMTGPADLENKAVSILPGGTTFIDVRDGQQGFRPAHEVRLNLNDLRINIQACESRISRAFYEDVFLMMAMDERSQPPTAEEIRARNQEKLIELGPVLEQVNHGVLKNLIDITFDVMVRQGLIPPPPDDLQGKDLKVEFVSIMAQAQKLLGASGVERMIGFAMNISAQTQDPSHMDKVDVDQALDVYGDILSVSPGIVRSDESVASLRESRAKAQQAQVASQQAADQAKAMKMLSETDMSKDSALSAMAG
jgi:hypothetical protein